MPNGIILLRSYQSSNGIAIVSRPGGYVKEIASFFASDMRDRWRNPDTKRQKGGRPKKTLIDPVRKSNVIAPHLQLFCGISHLPPLISM